MSENEDREAAVAALAEALRDPGSNLRTLLDSNPPYRGDYINSMTARDAHSFGWAEAIAKVREYLGLAAHPDLASKVAAAIPGLALDGLPDNLDVRLTRHAAGGWTADLVTPAFREGRFVRGLPGPAEALAALRAALGAAER